MKKIVSSVLIVSVFAIISCNKPNAGEFSNYIVDKKQSVDVAILQTDELIDTFFVLNNYDSVSAVAARMQNNIQKVIDEVAQKEVPQLTGASEFKGAFLDYLNYLRSIYANNMKMNATQTEEERNIIITDLQLILGNQKDEIAKLQAAQQKFATENKLNVE